MKRFFAATDYDGAPFKLFGMPHLVSLALLLLINVALIVTGQRYPVAWRTPTRIGLAALLVGQEIAMHTWKIATGIWDHREDLPLHLCAIAIWLGGVMLVTKNYRIYEFAYLLGLPGALQALITPDTGPYGFPHFRFFQGLISHGAIITAAVYMTTIEGFRPMPSSIVRVLLIGNLYMLVILLVNRAMGSNYLYVNHKPKTASILDVLPAWPWYLFHMEAMAAIMVLLLYLPFFIRDLPT
jgi:hypothetical integral membrane protein (TIGR02206 family)